MDIAIFLAQLWGPVVIAVAIGIFVSRENYIKIYRNLETDALAMLLFGMVMMSVGIAQVSVHNLWDTLPQIVVSLLGWGTLAKGAVFIVAPGFVSRMGNGWAKRRLIPFAGGLMLLIGAYLSYIAYFA